MQELSYEPDEIKNEIELMDIELDQLVKHELHPREDIEDVESLQASIKIDRLQEPIVVHEAEEGRFEVLDGMRRLQACRNLKTNEIPCLVKKELEAEEAARIAWIKNVERESLSPIEKAKHLKRVQERFQLSRREMALRGYGPPATITHYLKLLDLPQPVQEHIHKGRITHSHGYQLLNEDLLDDDRIRLAKKIIDNDLSVTATKAQIVRLSKGRKLKNQEKVQEAPGTDIPGVYWKDAQDMSEFSDESVQLIVTSPPSANSSQSANGMTVNEFLENNCPVMEECSRVLASGCVMAITIPDITKVNKKAGINEIKLMGSHYQNILKKHGVYLFDTIIWRKQRNGLQKSQRFDKAPSHAEFRTMDNFETIYLFRKKGKRQEPDPGTALHSELTDEEAQQYSDGVWDINTVPGQVPGLPQWPEELPERLIRMFSYKDDTVLDPFLGSGTTIKVARSLNREAVGYEINDSYKPVVMKRLGASVDAGEEIAVADNDVPVFKKTVQQQAEQDLDATDPEKIRRSFECMSQANDDNQGEDEVGVTEDAPVKANSDCENSDVSQESTENVIDFEAKKQESTQDASAEAQSAGSNGSSAQQVSIGPATLVRDDCVDAMKTMADNSVDCMVTDPPYGNEYMGKKWDKAVPGIDTWKECLRVLKPGAFAFVMCSNRQDLFHQTVGNLADAGFKVRFQSLHWTYSSGFTNRKSLSKALANDGHSEKAKQFEGAYSGFEPKLAVENIVVAMKPCKEPSYKKQALSNGKAVTWQDDCKIPCDGEDPRVVASLLVSDDALNDGKGKSSYSRFFSLDAWASQKLPFLIFKKASDEEKEAGLEAFPAKQIEGRDPGQDNRNVPHKKRPTAKKNPHSTPKPIDLMAYLVTLASREGDTVLDPFAGSGTTCIAAGLLNRRAVGIDMDAEYCKAAEARMRYFMDVKRDNDSQKPTQEQRAEAGHSGLSDSEKGKEREAADDRPKKHEMKKVDVIPFDPEHVDREPLPIIDISRTEAGTNTKKASA